MANIFGGRGLSVEEKGLAPNQLLSLGIMKNNITW